MKKMILIFKRVLTREGMKEKKNYSFIRGINSINNMKRMKMIIRISRLDQWNKINHRWSRNNLFKMVQLMIIIVLSSIKREKQKWFLKKIIYLLNNKMLMSMDYKVFK